jgi:hypothetical protein
VSNLAAIGFDGESPEEIQRLVAHAIDEAGPAPELGAAGHGHLLWSDGSGAAVAVHFGRAKEVACVTPFFAAPDGGTRWQVRTSAPHLDRECAHCSGADCDVVDPAGELVTRAAVQWAFFEPYRTWLARPRTFELQVVGFATGLALCSTAEELERAQASLFGEADPDDAPREPGKPMRLSDQAFLPYGMFAHEGEVTSRARAWITGKVESAATRTNGLTGKSFTHVRLSTLGGLIDVVAPAAPLDDGSPATLALADVWLVGRPCEPPPMPEPRSWLKKLVGG